MESEGRQVAKLGSVCAVQSLVLGGCRSASLRDGAGGAWRLQVCEDIAAGRAASPLCWPTSSDTARTWILDVSLSSKSGSNDTHFTQFKLI